MGRLSSRVQRLLRDMSEFVDGKAPTKDEVARIRDRVGSLLLETLRDDRHPLSEQLLRLRERVEFERRGTLYKDMPSRSRSSVRRTAHRHLFMPHPGAGDGEARRYWKLQLLLLTATWSEAIAERLAAMLSLDVADMRLAAKEAAEASVKFWSEPQYVQYLEQAARSLDHPDPSLPFRLNGRLVQPGNGTDFRLSQQQAALLNLLVNKVGQPVTYKELREAGIRYPAKVKCEIAKKFETQLLELPIVSSPGSYLLRESEP